MRGGVGNELPKKKSPKELADMREAGLSFLRTPTGQARARHYMAQAQEAGISQLAVEHKLTMRDAEWVSGVDVKWEIIVAYARVFDEVQQNQIPMHEDDFNRLITNQRMAAEFEARIAKFSGNTDEEVIEAAATEFRKAF